jgi:hypothetical protein
MLVHQPMHRVMMGLLVYLKVLAVIQELIAMVHQYGLLKNQEYAAAIIMLALAMAQKLI